MLEMQLVRQSPSHPSCGRFLGHVVAVGLQRLQLHVWWWICKLANKPPPIPTCGRFVDPCSCRQATTLAIACMGLDTQLARQPPTLSRIKKS